MSADEVTILGRSLERLAVDLLHALRDGVLSADELVRLGCDVPAVVRAAADLARRCAVVTLEIEKIAPASMAAVRRYAPVRPGGEAL